MHRGTWDHWNKFSQRTCVIELQNQLNPSVRTKQHGIRTGRECYDATESVSQVRMQKNNKKNNDYNCSVSLHASYKYTDT